MDRRNFNLNSKANVSCIQAKNLLMHWDLEKDDPIVIRHNKHLSTCQICQSEKLKLEQREVELRLEIPLPMMSLDAKNNFLSEMDEVFKRLDLGKSPKILRIKANRVNETIQSFYKIIFSREMLPVYCISGLTYFLLSKFL